MSSAQIELPKNTWVQVTTTDKSGSVHHQAGNTTVLYIEAATIPAALDATTPVMEATVKGQGWAYFNIASSDFLWAYAISEDAIIVVSPAGA